MYDSLNFLFYRLHLFSKGVSSHIFFCLLVKTISFACIHLSMMRFRFAYESIIRHSSAVLMIRWTGERERRRKKERERERERESEGNSSSNSSSFVNERERARERERKEEKILTFERRKHGSFVECSLLEMN